MSPEHKMGDSSHDVLIERIKEDTRKSEIVYELPKNEASVRFVEQINEMQFNMLRSIEKTQVNIVTMLIKLTAESEARAELAKRDAEISVLRTKIDELTELLHKVLQKDDFNV